MAKGESEQTRRVAKFGLELNRSQAALGSLSIMGGGTGGPGGTGPQLSAYRGLAALSPSPQLEPKIKQLYNTSTNHMFHFTCANYT